MSKTRAGAWIHPLLVLLLLIGAAGGALAAGEVPVDVDAGGSDGLAAPSAYAGSLIGEVVTGGASGSDEYVEIYNAVSVAIDLNGLEIVYVTSTGSTVTRKQIWTTTTTVEPGQHWLMANAAGIYAAAANGLYSGGLSATGGGMVLRVVGAEVIDSLSWGDASNVFVEGHAGAAPPARSSLERLPGGALGNGRDTGDNSFDT